MKRKSSWRKGPSLWKEIHRYWSINAYIIDNKEQKRDAIVIYIFVVLTFVNKREVFLACIKLCYAVTYKVDHDVKFGIPHRGNPVHASVYFSNLQNVVDIFSSCSIFSYVEKLSKRASIGIRVR